MQVGLSKRTNVAERAVKTIKDAILDVESQADDLWWWRVILVVLALHLLIWEPIARLRRRFFWIVRPPIFVFAFVFIFVLSLRFSSCLILVFVRGDFVLVLQGFLLVSISISIPVTSTSDILFLMIDSFRFVP